MSEYLRVTLVLPKSLWETVKKLAPARQRSRLVAEALDAEVRRRGRIAQLGQLETFQGYMRQKYGELPDSAEDIRMLREERDHEITGVR